MADELDVGVSGEYSFLFENILLEIDPEELIIDAEPVQKVRNFNVVIFILESYHVTTQFSKKLLENWIF